MHKWLRQPLYFWSVVCIFVLAFLLRAWSLHFGLPALNDPDELMFELGAVRMLRGLTLNPGWFGHPATTTMYLLAVINALVFGVGWLLGLFHDPKQFGDVIYADPSWVILPGRAAMLSFGLVVIALAFRLCTRFFGRLAGLFTLLLLSFSPLHIKFSQIIRSDMMACAFMLCVLLAAHRAMNSAKPEIRTYAPAAAWVGLAVTTKWPFIASGLAGVGAILSQCRDDVLPWRHGARIFFALGLMSVAMILCVSPYLLLDYPTVMSNLAGEARTYHLGATGGGALWNFNWYVTGPIWYALGPAGVLLACIGVATSFHTKATRFILLPVLFGFAVVLLSQKLVWDRWALPVAVLMAVFAGAGSAKILGAVPRRWALVSASVLALLVLSTIAPAAVKENAMRLNDTKQQATTWLIHNARPNTRVIIEHFAWDLSDQPFTVFFPLGDAGCVDAKAMLRGKVGYRTIEILRKDRSNVDIGTMPRSKLASCKVDYAILTQADRYFTERRRFPSEASNYEYLIGQGKTLAVFQPVDGVSSGPVIRIIGFDR